MKSLLLALLCSVSMIGFSQPVNFNAYRMNNGKIVDSTQTAYRKILNQQFSSLITGESKTAFGSFASADIADGKVAFAGSHLSKKSGNVFTLKATGEVTDGFHTLFTNSTFNTGIGLDAGVHFLVLKNKKLEYDMDSGDVHNEKVEKLEFEFNNKAIDIECEGDKLNLNRKKTKTIQLIDSLLIAMGKEPDVIKRGLILIEREKAKLMLDSVNNALNTLPTRRNSNRLLRNRTLDKLEALTFSNGVTGFSFGWVSVGYAVNHNKFKFLDTKLPVVSQVVDTSFITHSVRVQYSRYKLTAKPFGTYFWDAGVKFEYADNFSLLKKRELSETTEYGATPGARKWEKKYTAYEGAYQRDLKGITLYGDFFYFLFKNNNAAVHVNPEWIARTQEKPIANLYTGLLLAVKNAKTANAVVNFELYYKFLDLFETTDEDHEFFERNNIGIRFAFPISFKYNKLD